MTILEEASRITQTERNTSYGNPEVNHGCTAEMMEAYLRRKYGEAARFDALDVCAFNICQKLSRLANTPDHHDSLVDICGYARNWEQILKARS